MPPPTTDFPRGRTAGRGMLSTVAEAGVVAYYAAAVSCRKTARIADSSCGRSRLGRCPAQGSPTGRVPGNGAARRGRDQLEVQQVLRPGATSQAEPQGL